MQNSSTHHTLDSPSSSSYPPPPQKYARTSVLVPRKRGQDEEITAPLSTFRSLGFIQKKQKKKSDTSVTKENSAKHKCIDCLDACLLSRCCRRRKKSQPEFVVLQQPEPRQDLTFPEFAAYMVRSKQTYLLSDMDDVIRYKVNKHCWREWGFNRILRILGYHYFEDDLPGAKKTGYKAPRLSEIEVSRIYRNGLYMKEGWELWARTRYPNGTRPYGPPLP